MNAIDDLWAVASRRGPVDARRLLGALARVDVADLQSADARSTMLVRDAAAALRDFYGEARFKAASVHAKLDLNAIEPLPTDSRHFGLKGALVDATDPQAMFELLRDLGTRVRTPTRITIGGSLALMVAGLIERATHDIDLVDELPEAIRTEHDLLRSLTERYRLQLTHFQSHYLPEGWQRRLRSLGVFGSITALLVDPIDMLVCKVFSKRPKDLDDVRIALPQVDRATLVDRIATTTARWRAEPAMLETATRNWYVLTGEAELPPAR